MVLFEKWTNIWHLCSASTWVYLSNDWPTLFRPSPFIACVSSSRDDCSCQHGGGRRIHREAGGVPVRWGPVHSFSENYDYSRPVPASLYSIQLLWPDSPCSVFHWQTYAVIHRCLLLGGRGEDSSIIITLPECSAFSDIPEESLAKVFTYLTLIPRCVPLFFCTAPKAQRRYSEHSCPQLHPGSRVSNVLPMSSVSRRRLREFKWDQTLGLFVPPVKYPPACI